MSKVPQYTSIGNTTFRRAWRVPKGLRVLDELINNYPFNINSNSEDFEAELKRVLVENEVIESETTASTSDGWKGAFGRKFLSNCYQLGFIAPRPRIIRGQGKYDLDINGNDKQLAILLSQLSKNLKMNNKPYCLTPLGEMLADTTSDGKELTPEQKDIFLKSLYYHQQPSFLQPFPDYYEYEPFRPIKLYIDLLSFMASNNMEAHITAGEMAAVINRYKTNDISPIIREIKSYRHYKTGKEKPFAIKWIKKFEGKKANYDTSEAYQDINFANSICTGIFLKKGKKLILNNDKLDTIQAISKENKYYENKPLVYLNNLWSGKLLPFENYTTLAKQVKRTYKTLTKDFKEYKVKIPELPSDKITEIKLKKISYRLENKLNEVRELDYFLNQRKQTFEIVKILSNLHSKIEIETDIFIKPLPEHLEWIIWRVFLAINSFKTKLRESRGFPVDENFFPTHHAPGGKEDMYFEFDNFVLVLEVTFKTGEAQSKDEIVPVYRHVINKSQKFKPKPVYCIFIAPTISMYTAKEFKDYFVDDSGNEYIEKIVPITIMNFTKLFEEQFHKNKRMNPEFIKNYLDKCLGEKDKISKAKEWLAEIEKITQNTISL